MRTVAILAVVAAFGVTTPALARPIKLVCDRGFANHEVFEVTISSDNTVLSDSVAVELHDRNELPNVVKASKTFPVTNVTGIPNVIGIATDSEVALGAKLPAENERSWTIRFGDNGENSLTMRFWHPHTESYGWTGHLTMVPRVEGDCYADRQ